jgi:hypothetical protein
LCAYSRIKPTDFGEFFEIMAKLDFAEFFSLNALGGCLSLKASTVDCAKWADERGDFTDQLTGACFCLSPKIGHLP